MDASDYCSDAESRMLRLQKYLRTYFLIVKILLVILLGAYLQVLVSMLCKSIFCVSPLELGLILSASSLMFAIGCALSTYIKYQRNWNAKKYANTLIGIFGIVAFGISSNHPEFTPIISVLIPGLITGIILIGFQTSILDPFSDFSLALILSIVPSFLIMRFINLQYGFDSILIYIFLIWITALIIIIPRLMDSYYAKNQSNIFDLDYHIYVMIYIFGNPSIIFFNLFMSILVGVFK